MSRGARGSRNTSIISKLIIIFLIIIAILVFFLLFRTSNIAVTGNAHYSDEQIEDYIKSQKLSFNTVLLCLINHNAPVEGAQFISDINVSLLSPSEVLVEVNEKVLAGYTYNEGKYVYFDSSGIIQAVTTQPEPAKTEGARFIPLVEGIETKTDIIGRTVGTSDKSVFATLGSICNYLSDSTVLPEKVLVESDGCVALIYGDIKVKLGNDPDVEVKMSQMYAMLDKAGGLKGTLHLEEFDENSKQAVFDKEN